MHIYVRATCAQCSKPVTVYASFLRTQAARAEAAGRPYVFLCSRSCSALYRSHLLGTDQHGTDARYSKGCRCALCTRAHTNYLREYRKTHSFKKAKSTKAGRKVIAALTEAVEEKKLTERQKELIEKNKRFAERIKKARQSIKEGKGTKLEEVDDADEAPEDWDG